MSVFHAVEQEIQIFLQNLKSLQMILWNFYNIQDPHKTHQPWPNQEHLEDTLWKILVLSHIDPALLLHWNGFHRAPGYLAPIKKVKVVS